MNKRTFSLILGTITVALVIGTASLISASRNADTTASLLQATAQFFDCTVIGTTESGQMRLRCVDVEEEPTATQTPSETATDEPTATDTDVPPTSTDTNTPSPTLTATVTRTPARTSTPGNIAPFPSAPPCPASAHGTNDRFHTLWNSDLGCHFDHEHGTNLFTAEVARVFPGFDLKALLGNVEIGHTNPSSPMENTHKHGGFKWDVMLANPHGCIGGFEGAAYCIKAAVIQYHAFGDYSIEMEARQHSVVYLLKICDPANQNDCGILFVNNLEDYGQRVTPYQGFNIPYPNSPSPTYDTPRGPYFTTDCVFANLPGCRESIAQVISRNLNAASKWSSKPTGRGERPAGNHLADILFDVRNTYQLFDSRDQTYPFNFLWICSSDGGETYNPEGCKYNNTATSVHEVGGTIPSSWDNLRGFDTNPAVGRITAEGFVDAVGNLAPSCTEAGGSCYPVKMVNMFVGQYGDYLGPEKVSNLTPLNTPSRDIFWCNGRVCSETTPGAVSSGWVGQEN